MSASVRGESGAGGLRFHTAHVRCSHGHAVAGTACDAEVTFSVGGDDSANRALSVVLARAEDSGWEIGTEPRCPSHRRTPRPATVLLLGTMDTPWRAEATAALAARARPGAARVRVLSNEDPSWLGTNNINNPQQRIAALIGNDLALIARADVVLWHHGLVGETAGVELGLLAGLPGQCSVPWRTVVHVEPGVPLRPYAEALCCLRNMRWAQTLEHAAEIAAGIAEDVSREYTALAGLDAALGAAAK